MSDNIIISAKQLMHEATNPVVRELATELADEYYEYGCESLQTATQEWDLEMLITSLAEEWGDARDAEATAKHLDSLNIPNRIVRRRVSQKEVI